VLICPATRRLVGGLFYCQDLGPTRLNGFAAAVQVTRVMVEHHRGGTWQLQTPFFWQLTAEMLIAAGEFILAKIG
jgi:hypothetical protein